MHKIPFNIDCVPYILVYDHYRLTEKYPSSFEVDPKLSFAEQCLLLNIELPLNCNYALFFFNSCTIKLSDNGVRQIIIINPKNYEQNS